MVHSLLKICLWVPLLIAPLSETVSLTIDQARYGRLDSIVWVEIKDDDSSDYMEFVVENKDLYLYMTGRFPDLIDVDEYISYMTRGVGHPQILGDINQMAVVLTQIADPLEARETLKLKQVHSKNFTFIHFGVENETELLHLYFEPVDSEMYIGKDNLHENPDVMAFFIELGYLLIRDDFTGNISLVKP